MASELFIQQQYSDWEPEYEDRREESHPRDSAVDAAKEMLRRFFGERPEEVFYQRQLQVIWERNFFHWITARALAELAAEDTVACDTLPLPPTGTITFYRRPTHRYWRRQASEIVELVTQFSAQPFTHGVGAQGEMLFEAALGAVGFRTVGRKAREYGNKRWEETGHDLDRIFERDGVAYGTEVKNTLSYIPRDELYAKMAMCKHLGLRPLFIVRMAPKNYIYDVQREGGFTLVFQYQLYPFGAKGFADRVRERLGIPVDCPSRIADGTVQRLVNWHSRRVARPDTKMQP